MKDQIDKSEIEEDETLRNVSPLVSKKKKFYRPLLPLSVTQKTCECACLYVRMFVCVCECVSDAYIHVRVYGKI